ncbi:hypothetical protein ACN38_g6802 [Penicillium nordicum]|uniref:Methyltransferase domain-containing protein n=1 Tax=Penicillium nordicum TaxID=229535 RepID=A0A0M8P811_9EURO|nr:hypothetical protein ACN38_g6802 [Penicillium nordicum]
MSCLAPGGWIEVADVCYMTTSDDGSLDNAKGLLRFDAMYRKALNQMNPNLGTLSSLYEKMVDAGFQSCSVTKRKIPVSDMSTDPELNELSRYSLEIHEMDTAIISERALQPILNLSTKEVETVLADALRDMRDKNIHAYRYGYVFCAQKPLEP